MLENKRTSFEMLEAQYPIIHMHQTIVELSHFLAQRFVKLARDAVNDRGSFHVALSGGQTPQLFYSLLSSVPYSEHIPWRHIYLYQTDERFVAFTHQDNNYKMLKEKLIDSVPVPVEQVFGIQTDHLSSMEAAMRYEAQLRAQLPVTASGLVQFDFVLLGIGVDGHIASLFPEIDALLWSEALVIDVFIKSQQARRVSLTLRAFRAARTIAIIATGANKAPIVEAALQHVTPEIYPVQKLKSEGLLEWYLDASLVDCLMTKIKEGLFYDSI